MYRFEDMSGGLQLFAVISEPLGDWNPPSDLTAKHVAFLLELESRAVTVLSGPLGIDESGWPGSGLTVIRAASLNEANRIMGDEPYAVAGVRQQSIRPWLVTSGALEVRLRLSDPPASFT